ncbi:MAG: protein kinase [Ghiorsea sp.]|nr:protein kinase [Ghiorsea sp.]
MGISILKKNTFWIVLLAIVLMGMQWLHLAPISQVNQFIYDYSIQLVHKNPSHAENIVLVSIHADDLSQQDSDVRLKQAIANVLAVVRKAKSKSVSILIPLDKHEDDSSLSYLDNIEAYLQGMDKPKSDIKALTSLVNMAREDLDIDSLLAKEIHKGKHVYLPYYSAKPLSKIPDFLKSSVVNTQPSAKTSNTMIFATPKRYEQGAIYEDAFPLERLANNAYGLGYLSTWYDEADGRVRSVQLVQSYGQTWVASLPLLLTTEMMNMRAKDIVLAPMQSVELANKHIPLDSKNRVLPYFYSTLDENTPVFQRYTYQQLMSGEVGKKQLQGKIVLLDAPDKFQSIHTPAGEISGFAELTAHTVTSLLNQDVYTQSSNMLWITLVVFLMITLYLLFALPRLRLMTGILSSLFVLFLLLASEVYMLLGQQVWLYGGINILLLVAGVSLILTRKVLQIMYHKQTLEMAQVNRQLGLMLQEKGKLEQAFERFQQLPITKSSLDLLYNLALDFERKRKFNNTVAVYQYILQQRPDFKDVATRMITAEKMQHVSSMGTGQFSTITSLLSQGSEKPMLGRFVLERELGRGAMGAVYLGRDPKIDRVVAVKTLALAEEFESTEVKEVEQRFFHEASAAGRLNHPNIVTIYDAAEDHDLAYIAMEYIEGKSLSDFAQKDTLLPVPMVLNIIAKIADALDYAGKKEIVHRDIKPANIMYHEESGTVKVTDFGIARIASSGRTKTGMILGTPSFMSPEQMNGQHVDSRSDIFSLGVTMYVLLTGVKPFQGDSLAAISYKIVNDKHPDILMVRSDLPTCVKAIINKALHKEPDKRYQTGGTMRRALLRCIKTLVDS